MIVVLMALAGGLGAGARFVVDGTIRARWRTAFPVATVIINVSGSLLLGLLAGLVVHHHVPAEIQTVLGTGFMGGYTTFSTASVEAVRLVQTGRWFYALASALGTLLLCLGACAMGLWLAS